MQNLQAFIPGKPVNQSVTLARFLPRLSAGVVSTWLKNNLSPGDLVLDPFGASPLLAEEVARAGFRVVVTANNPVVRFLIEMVSTPPRMDEMQAALSELAHSRLGGDQLEQHIRGLYTTRCNGCFQDVGAEAYLWERDAETPYARIFNCTCGQSGEFLVTNADTEKASRFSELSLHHARALERVAPRGHPDREHAEEALGVYTPRAVYALFTMINKLDSLQLGQRRRDILSTLLLSACDKANTLWTHPGGRTRPLSLSIPPKFRENNVWFGLENAVKEWESFDSGVSITQWPRLPPESGGICLYNGPLRDLTDTLSQVEINAVVTAFPRPNQAFWTLSALWSGWLWGRGTIGSYRSVLRRRRYGWSWHTTALHATLSHLVSHLKPGTSFFGLVTESEPGFNHAVMVAADMGNCSLENIALRIKSKQTQISWQYMEETPSTTSLNPEMTITESGLNFLKQYGAPVDYLRLQAASLSGLAHEGLLSDSNLSPAENFSKTRAWLETGFPFRSGFLRFSGSESSIEVGKWWMRDPFGLFISNLDRLEINLVNHLISNPNKSTLEIEISMCDGLRGLLTPERESIVVALESYAIESTPGQWHLRPSDTPLERNNDIDDIRDLVAKMGKQLEFTINEDDPLLWQQLGGQVRYVFYIIASALLGKIVFNSNYPPEQCFIVVPGGRAKLIMHKLQSNPRLAQEINKGWRFVKFRHIRWLVENPALSRQILDDQIALDPLTYSDSQIPLF
jgi:hypothetical protein